VKTIILLSVTVFGTLGGFVPYLWGDDNFFGVASILWGAIGGFFGIWVGIKLGRMWLE